MNKTELLADLGGKVLRVVATEKQSDAVKEAAGVNSYITHIIEQNGQSVTGRNIGWYVVDEGLPSETAYFRDNATPKSVVRSVAQTYLDSLIPATYIRGTLGSVNEEDRSARATVIKNNGDSTASEKQILIYKNGATPITHIELK